MGYNKKQSSDDIVDLAVKTIKDKSASKTAKSLAGSVIAQANTGKQTGKEMETKAAKVLQSDKYSDKTKSLAGSVVSQSNKER
ncbi:hypothetical protein [Pseudodesulfovibrio karagichevae]|uniref:Antitoxin protein of toxin-antitoxin system n=1 Tax=Pseudodesulfovibrio karagichevae TaxID=3239305 RepID=A0ABV4K265_9BACT